MKFYKLTFYPDHPKNVTDGNYIMYAYKDMIIQDDDVEKEMFVSVTSRGALYDLQDPDKIEDATVEEIREVHKGTDAVEDLLDSLTEEEEDEESVE